MKNSKGLSNCRIAKSGALDLWSHHLDELVLHENFLCRYENAFPNNVRKITSKKIFRRKRRNA